MLRNSKGESVTVELATPLSACFDIRAAESSVLLPGDIKLIKTDLFLDQDFLPSVDFCIKIYSRSGLSLKRGLIVPNSPGIIDADYEGEIGVILYNASKTEQSVEEGDRIAQAEVCTVYREYSYKVLSNKRKGGFGSSGI